MKACVHPVTGEEYYSYILQYVDDTLVISHDGMTVLKRIDYFFKMKKGSMVIRTFILV